MFKESTRKYLPAPVINLSRRVRNNIHHLIEHKTISREPSVVNETVAFSETSPTKADFLIGTSSGLMLYSRGTLRRVFDGFVYGITHYKGAWYVYRKHVTSYSKRAIGQIISFYLDDKLAVQSLRIVENRLDPGIHQIDAWQNHLYVMDSGNNRIIRYLINGPNLANREDFYPSGVLSNGSSSPNYVHMNSIFHDMTATYVVYHNHTRHSGRKSEIAVLDDQLELLRLVSTKASSAHNIYQTETSFHLCDSQGGGFIWDEEYLDCGCFTRGLALSDVDVFVGGSDWAERDERERSTGYISVFDRSTKALKSRIRISGAGSIYEIRLVEPQDHAMSSFNEKNNTS